jgi:hypothetical protein
MGSGTYERGRDKASPEVIAAGDSGNHEKSFAPTLPGPVQWTMKRRVEPAGLELEERARRGAS